MRTDAMKHPFQNWVCALRREPDKNQGGSGGVFTRSLLCGVVFSTVGLCWKSGDFARYGLEDLLRAWAGLLGHIFLAMLLFTLGMVSHQTLMERRDSRRVAVCFWLILGVAVTLLIVS